MYSPSNSPQSSMKNDEVTEEMGLQTTTNTKILGPWDHQSRSNVIRECRNAEMYGIEMRTSFRTKCSNHITQEPCVGDVSNVKETGVMRILDSPMLLNIHQPHNLTRPVKIYPLNVHVQYNGVQIMLQPPPFRTRASSSGNSTIHNEDCLDVWEIWWTRPRCPVEDNKRQT